MAAKKKKKSAQKPRKKSASKKAGKAARAVPPVAKKGSLFKAISSIAEARARRVLKCKGLGSELAHCRWG